MDSTKEENPRTQERGTKDPTQERSFFFPSCRGVCVPGSLSHCILVAVIQSLICSLSLIIASNLLERTHVKKILGDLRMSRPCRSYSSTGQHDVVTMLLVAVWITVR